jgi:hypothetical protein
MKKNANGLEELLATESRYENDRQMTLRSRTVLRVLLEKSF